MLVVEGVNTGIRGGSNKAFRKFFSPVKFYVRKMAIKEKLKLVI